MKNSSVHFYLSHDHMYIMAISLVYSVVVIIGLTVVQYNADVSINMLLVKV